MKPAQVILILLGAAGLIVFGAVIPKRVLNAGNLLGLFVSALVLLAGLRLDGIRRFFAYCLTRGAVGHTVVGMLLGAVGVIVFLAVLISCRMAAGMRVPPKAGATAIVLGCEVRGEQPSRALRARIDAAADYLAKNPKAKAILSGGKGSGERISEAACMERELLARGISQDRLILEDASRSTRENLVYSAKIMRKQCLGSDAAIVTSEFHCCRARLIAKKEGISAGCVPAKTPLLYLPTFWVREMLAVLYEWQFGI